MNPCRTSVLTLNPISDISYNLRDPAHVVTFTFNSDKSVTVCGNLILEATYVGGAALDSLVFTFNPLGTLVIQTSDPLKASQTY